MTLAGQIFPRGAVTWVEPPPPVEPSWGPPQSVYTTQVPVSDVSRSAGSFGNDLTFAVAGQITAFRYYRSALESGTVTTTTIRVWSSGGVSLTFAATSGEATGAGWRTATLGTPLVVTAGQTVRVVKEFAATRRDAYTTEAGFTNGAITRGTGWFKFGAGYPTTDNGGTSYFVDVTFEAAT